MILDRFSLAGKVAIVTGSNTGLGQGFCRAFQVGGEAGGGREGFGTGRLLPTAGREG